MRIHFVVPIPHQTLSELIVVSLLAMASSSSSEPRLPLLTSTPAPAKPSYPIPTASLIQFQTYNINGIVEVYFNDTPSGLQAAKQHLIKAKLEEIKCMGGRVMDTLMNVNRVFVGYKKVELYDADDWLHNELNPDSDFVEDDGDDDDDDNSQ